MTLHRLSAICAAIFLAGSILLFLATLALLHGHFIYPLDDPYIHLALAEQIAHGHYGINPGEVSSPSSSILWPFLLTPFAGTRFSTFLPLLWNLFFGTVAAALIGRFTGIWMKVNSADRFGKLRVLLVAVLLIFSANLMGLALLGMEHELQVLLAVCVAFGVAEFFADRPIPWWCILAAGIAPAVRYESLSLTVAMVIALAGARRWKTAVWLFLGSLLPLLGFAIFLHHIGLARLPQSVLIKGSIGPQHGLGRYAGIISHNLGEFRLAPLRRIPLLIITVLFIYLFSKARTRTQMFALASVIAVGVLQFLFGQFGWFHRYEVFAVIFATMLVLPAAASAFLSQKALAAVLLVSASSYILAFVLTPFASRDIYLQQAQMHRFATDFYRGNVAINDLGMASFQRTPGTFVLDLFGLASPEAAAHPLKEADWMEDVTTRKQTSLAMIYTHMFHIPASWVMVGKLCEHPTPGTLIGEPCVAFYSTRPDTADELRLEFRAFSTTLPPGSTATVY